MNSEVPEKKERAEKYLQKLANEGHKETIFELAEYLCYEVGDSEHGEKYIKMAADLGHAKAQYEMGMIYKKKAENASFGEYHNYELLSKNMFEAAQKNGYIKPEKKEYNYVTPKNNVSKETDSGKSDGCLVGCLGKIGFVVACTIFLGFLCGLGIPGPIAAIILLVVYFYFKL